jgi:archaeoflavoprotein AfpA
MSVRVAWGITGSGDHLTESVEAMVSLKIKHDLHVDVILSKAGETVVDRYKLRDTLTQNFAKVFIEKDANTPFLVAPLQQGKYDLLLICPATANTTAKIAHGIADSLLTNCVAQTMKARVPTYIFPVDQQPGEIVTILPSGRKLALSMRDIDLENASKLRRMKGITVLSAPREIEGIMLSFLRKTDERGCLNGEH